MKTITTTTMQSGLSGTSSEVLATLTDYVSDDYEEFYLDTNVAYDAEGDNYTKTLREACGFVEALGDELEEMWRELEDFSTRIEGDATLSEKDRESLTSALDGAVHELYGFSEERYDALTALEEALDAFKNLTLSE